MLPTFQLFKLPPFEREVINTHIVIQNRIRPHLVPLSRQAIEILK